MTPPETAGVALELERLRGDLGRDLGEIRSMCAVLVERSSRAESDIRDLEIRTAALERRVWSAAGAAAAIGGLGGWLAQTLG